VRAFFVSISRIFIVAVPLGFDYDTIIHPPFTDDENHRLADKNVEVTEMQ
jgi:hypothetical protein